MPLTVFAAISAAISAAMSASVYTQALKRLEHVKASGGRGVANAGDDLGLEDFEAAAVRSILYLLAQCKVDRKPLLVRPE